MCTPTFEWCPECCEAEYKDEEACKAYESPSGDCTIADVILAFSKITYAADDTSAYEARGDKPCLNQDWCYCEKNYHALPAADKALVELAPKWAMWNIERIFDQKIHFYLNLF